MGYVFLTAPCARCGRLFASNPARVPSVRLKPDGPREPVCEDCVRAIQALQREKGLPVWPDPLPGAYEPAPEEEVPW